MSNRYSEERTINKVIVALRNFPHLNKKKRFRIIEELLYDEEFISWLFQPDEVPNLTEIVEELYTELVTPDVIATIVRVMDVDGETSFNRSVATFLTTVANIAIQQMNEDLDDYDSKRKQSYVSQRDRKKMSMYADEMNKLISKLIKRARTIIKKDAKVLSEECRLPRYLCVNALTSIPDPKYVDHSRIGYYMNTLFTSIYSDVNMYGDFESRPRWKPFFKVLFGKDNVVEVATFILLEGVHRIDKLHDHPTDVRACWDSLTEFALEELNDSPTAVRDHMIEIYMKKLDKMFGNGTFDLRVDFRKIDDFDFPKLAETIDKYADKLTSILNGKE